MPTQYASRLEELAAQQRAALERRSADAADRMTRQWVTAQKRVDVEVQSLLRKMEAARAAGITPSPAWLYQQRRLAQVTDTIRQEVFRWAPHAEEATWDLARDAMEAADANARELAQEATRVDLPGVEAGFTDINPENAATMLGHLAPGGPVRDLLVSIGGEAADAAEAALVQGVLLGKGSDWISRELKRALDIPRWRAETIARTEALRTYRETSRLTYDGATTVGSWTWHAALDRRSCPACVVMHGTHHPTTETLDGHPRCRCSMVPRTKTWAELGVEGVPETRPDIQTGKDWLQAQSPATQRAVLGPRKFQAWKEGKVTLDDFVARTHSPAWGSMRRERSMVEIAKGRNPNTLPDAPVQVDDPLANLPASRYPEPELRRFQAQLREMDDPQLYVQRQRDPAVKELVAREKARRAALRSQERRTMEATRPAMTPEAPTVPGNQDWEGSLPKRSGEVISERRTVTLQAIGGDTARYLEGVPGVRRNPDGSFTITDHGAAIQALQRARTVYAQTAATDAMDALRLRRVDGYLEELEDARGGKVLPEYRQTNPRWKEARQWQVNCTNCVSAHELRRRGFDVTAAPRPTGRGRYRHDYYQDWGGSLQDALEEVTVLQMKRKMAKEWPVGARGFVSVTWKGRRAGAHVFSVEKMPDGTLHFTDPQSGKDLGDGAGYWSQARAKVSFIRVDDKPLTDKLEDYILRPGEDYGDKKKGR